MLSTKKVKLVSTTTSVLLIFTDFPLKKEEEEAELKNSVHPFLENTVLQKNERR